MINKKSGIVKLTLNFSFILCVGTLLAPPKAVSSQAAGNSDASTTDAGYPVLKTAVVGGSAAAGGAVCHLAGTGAVTGLGKVAVGGKIAKLLTSIGIATTEATSAVGGTATAAEALTLAPSFVAGAPMVCAFGGAVVCGGVVWGYLNERERNRIQRGQLLIAQQLNALREAELLIAQNLNADQRAELLDAQKISADQREALLVAQQNNATQNAENARLTQTLERLLGGGEVLVRIPFDNSRPILVASIDWLPYQRPRLYIAFIQCQENERVRILAAIRRLFIPWVEAGVACEDRTPGAERFKARILGWAPNDSRFGVVSFTKDKETSRYSTNAWGRGGRPVAAPVWTDSEEFVISDAFAEVLVQFLYREVVAAVANVEYNGRLEGSTVCCDYNVGEGSICMRGIASSLSGNFRSAEENPVAEVENFQCSVCLDRQKNTVLFPCSHVLCDVCVATLAAIEPFRCPECREPVGTSQRVYL